MSYKLMAALGAAVMIAALPAGAAGFYGGPPNDVPAGYEVCVNAQKELDLCPIPGYKPPPPNGLPSLADSLAAGEMYKMQHQDPAETRHKELIGQIKSLEDTIRIIDAERPLPR